MSNFDKSFALLLQHEGGYSNHPADPGGKTRFGVTERVARDFGYNGDMRDLPLDIAKQVYKKGYWKPEFDSFQFIVAFNVFDGCVNSGVSQSIRWLQRAVGASDDGLIGPATVSKVVQIPAYEVVCKYNSERLRFLKGLKNWGSFSRGWADRIARNLSI